MTRTKKHIITVTENKDIPDWRISERFEAIDDYYGISCFGSKKDECINFVKGSILHAIAHGYPDYSVVPDELIIKFEIVEK